MLKEKEAGRVEENWGCFSKHVKTNSPYVKCGHSKIHWLNEKEHFSMESSSKIKKTLSWDFDERTTVNIFGKSDFEVHNESRLSEYINFWRLQFHDLKARRGLTIFQTIIPGRIETFRTQPLVE